MCLFKSEMIEQEGQLTVVRYDVQIWTQVEIRVKQTDK